MFADIFKLFISFQLDIHDTADYKQRLEETGNFKINSRVLIELINNSTQPDTSLWTDAELKNFVLVKTRDDYIYIKEVIKKFNITDADKTKFYRKQINSFNNTSAWDKEIFYFTRPIFDSSGRFALIGFNNGHSGLGGGGTITLFQLKEGIWQEIGDIELWKY